LDLHDPGGRGCCGRLLLACAGDFLAVPQIRRFSFFPCGDVLRQVDNQEQGRKGMGILWIILIVILVLALLGFFSRGYW
jgi:hypothetical protein